MPEINEIVTDPDRREHKAFGDNNRQQSFERLWLAKSCLQVTFPFGKLAQIPSCHITAPDTHNARQEMPDTKLLLARSR